MTIGKSDNGTQKQYHWNHFQKNFFYIKDSDSQSEFTRL